MSLEKESYEKIREGIFKNDEEQWHIFTIYVTDLVDKRVHKIYDQQDREDIKQNVFLKIVKNIQISFFLNSNYDNSNPENLDCWIHTITRNCMNTYFKKNKSEKEQVSQYFDDDEGDNKYDKITPSVTDVYYTSEEIEMVYGLLNEVINMKNAPYKTLTWIVFVLYHLESHKKVSERMEKNLKGKNLYEILDEIERRIGEYDNSFEEFQSDQREKFLESNWYEILLKSLDVLTSEGTPIGEEVYESFFMKKGGKASISDWVNRINQKLRVKKENDLG